MATMVEVDNNGNEYPLEVSGEALATAVIEATSSGITKIDNINAEIIEGNMLDKLRKLEDTKNRITQTIESIGVAIPPESTFSQYPQFIEEILSVIAGSLLDDLNSFADDLLNILGNEEI